MCPQVHSFPKTLDLITCSNAFRWLSPTCMLSVPSEVWKRDGAWALGMIRTRICLVQIPKPGRGFRPDLWTLTMNTIQPHSIRFESHNWLSNTSNHQPIMAVSCSYDSWAIVGTKFYCRCPVNLGPVRTDEPPQSDTEPGSFLITTRWRSIKMRKEKGIQTQQTISPPNVLLVQEQARVGTKPALSIEPMLILS